MVFDLGAYTGTYADNIFKNYRCNIFAFEPVKQFYDVLQKKYANEPKVRCFMYGLGEEDRTMTLGISGKATSEVTSGQSVECQIRNIKTFLDEQKINTIDLMAINIEGGEYPLLEMMRDEGLLRRVKIFQIQFHDFPHIERRHERRYALQQELSKTHNLAYNYEFCWEKWVLKA